MRRPTRRRLAIAAFALAMVVVAIVMALPGILRGLGLHPSFDGERY